MNNIDKLEPECFYHIYNRAVGNEILFKNSSDYDMFFSKFERFLGNKVDIYAYCLIPNHFHLLVKIKSEPDLERVFENETNDWNLAINQIFSNFFNSYTKTFNKFRGRKGKLFMLPYRRKQIQNDKYFTLLTGYIHRNPVHHFIVKKPEQWKHSSYNILNSNIPTKLMRTELLEWFGGKNEFVKYHNDMLEEYNKNLLGYHPDLLGSRT
ncbi:MAG: transposase [Chitinophagales bacterium]